MKISIIGAGISGIGAAIILKKAGHNVVLYEKSPAIGGVWALAYPNVQLQNIGSQYHFSDFPWPHKPELHPTGQQIRDYLQAAVAHFGLEVHLNTKVKAMEESANGWQLQLATPTGTSTAEAEFVISSIGQYTEGKNRPKLPGEDTFSGEIITERDVRDLDDYRDKQVAVVGFGKSALDMASFTAERGAKVAHVFRTPRWTIPFKILGIHYTHALFSRFGSLLMTSWAHPTGTERWIHRRMTGFVNGFWKSLSSLFATLAKAKGKGTEAKKRIRTALPDHSLVKDLRSATALQPVKYFDQVAAGTILPYRAELEGFTAQGLKLSTGEEVPAEVVILALGSTTPKFPFMPKPYRQLLEQDYDGVQLYRHLIHPEIPNFAFAGYNHGFMHIPALEVGMVWLHAYLSGDLLLPNREAMYETINHVRDWKRAHIHFEPSRLCAINTRFQQYLDILCKELQVSAYRKKNPIAEVFGRYLAKDYQGVYEEYVKAKGKRKEPLQVLPLHT